MFTSDNGTFDHHYTAQEGNCNRYLATLVVLQKNGTEIAQGEYRKDRNKCWKIHAYTSSINRTNSKVAIIICAYCI